MSTPFFPSFQVSRKTMHRQLRGHLVTLLLAGIFFRATEVLSQTPNYPIYLPLVIRQEPTSTPTPSPTASPPATLTPTATPNCHPSYPGVCIHPPPPDLNCDDIPYRNFSVLPPDPHGFDRDGDGVGCEE